jgi:hypothetical protein
MTSVSAFADGTGVRRLARGHRVDRLDVPECSTGREADDSNWAVHVVSALTIGEPGEPG